MIISVTSDRPQKESKNNLSLIGHYFPLSDWLKKILVFDWLEKNEDEFYFLVMCYLTFARNLCLN